MKLHLKSGIVYFIIGATTMAAVPVVAKTAQEMISVTYKDIKVYADGQEVDTTGSEPFIYNGQTYLPIKQVGEAFGKSVNWNGNTNSVYLGTSVGNEVSIFDVMQPYASQSYTQYSGNNTFEFAGAERRNGFKLRSYESGNYVVFNTDNKYNALSFEALGDIDSSKIQIFANGGLVQEIKVPRSDVPKKINISLKGVQQLKITTTNDVSSMGMGMAFDTGFWNVKLY